MKYHSKTLNYIDTPSASSGRLSAIDLRGKLLQSERFPPRAKAVKAVSMRDLRYTIVPPAARSLATRASESMGEAIA